jgi:hypothetical protein
LTQPGTVNDDLVSLIDVFPTLINGLGLEYPGDSGSLPGVNLYSSGGLSSDREMLFMDLGSGRGRWVSVRTKSHKYALWASGGREELFNLDDDPMEMNNLVTKQPELARRLRSQLIAWERKYGIPGSLDGDTLRAFPEPDPPAEEDCRFVAINQGRWPENLPEDEMDTVETYEEAMRKALSKETFDLNTLSIQEYIEKTGNPVDKIRFS